MAAEWQKVLSRGSEVRVFPGAQGVGTGSMKRDRLTGVLPKVQEKVELTDKSESKTFVHPCSFFHNPCFSVDFLKPSHMCRWKLAEVGGGSGQGDLLGSVGNCVRSILAAVKGVLERVRATWKATQRADCLRGMDL